MGLPLRSGLLILPLKPSQTRWAVVGEVRRMQL